MTDGTLEKPDSTSAGPGADDPGPRHESQWLLMLFILAAVMRLGAAVQTYVISKDGVSWYISVAREALERWDWRPLVEGDHHPLYAAVLAVAGYLIGDWEVAGQTLGVVLGAMLIFPCYSFTKTIFGRRTALFAAVVVAMMPRYAEYCGDVLSEPLANLLMMTAVAFGAKWARDYRWRDSALAGLFGGLSYLARAEGLCLALGLIGWAAVALIVGAVNQARQRPGLRAGLRRAATVLPALALFFALGFPYVLEIHRQTGQWRLTKTHHIRSIMTLEPEQLLGGVNFGLEDGELRQSARREFSWRLWLLSRRFGEANYPWVFLMFVGLWQIRKRRYEVSPAWFVSAHFWGLFVVFMLFNYRSTYALPRRHFINLGALAMPWMGLGLEVLWDRARLRGSDAAGVRWRRALAGALLIAALALSFYFAWRPHRLDKLGLREAGQWVLRAHGGPGARVLTLTDVRPAFYAEAEILTVSWEDKGAWDRPHEFADLKPEMARLKPDYLIILTDEADRAVPHFCDEAFKAGMRPIQVFKKSGEGDSDAEVWVYRLAGERAQPPEGARGAGF